jgi:hypothetical protein
MLCFQLCLCLLFACCLTTACAKLKVRMARYSFPVRLFHSLLHAGLSRRTDVPPSYSVSAATSCANGPHPESASPANAILPRSSFGTRMNAAKHAFCLMLNHIHLLCETPFAGLSQIMHDILGNCRNRQWRQGICETHLCFQQEGIQLDSMAVKEIESRLAAMAMKRGFPQKHPLISTILTLLSFKRATGEDSPSVDRRHRLPGMLFNGCLGRVLCCIHAHSRLDYFEKSAD